MVVDGCRDCTKNRNVGQTGDHPQSSCRRRVGQISQPHSEVGRADEQDEKPTNLTNVGVVLAEQHAGWIEFRPLPKASTSWPACTAGEPEPTPPSTTSSPFPH
mgnify:CR=1 FL=1|jgi:hypothetical protein